MKNQSTSGDLVGILLATYNGSRFLGTQLESLESQIHQNWFVIASDDGSSDDTLSILQDYQARWPKGKLSIQNGPAQGFCKNFLSLACDAEISADFYAFCDQDDVWLPKKLTVAIENIHKNQEDGYPYVYCGRTTYVDERLKKVGISPLFSYPRTFRNALVQSMAGGNTMVFNQKTKNLLEKVGIVDHPSHDWWVYQLATGAGGEVFYDHVPQVLYRQHKNAVIGGNNSFGAKLERVSMVFKGQFTEWNNQNMLALSRVKPSLSHENKETLELFENMRSASLKNRLRLLAISGLYRQTWRGTISLYLAVLLKKF